MNPGRLRHCVEIQKPERSQDQQGGYVTRWVTIPHGLVWCEIIPTSSSKAYEAAQLMHGVTHDIVTWYIPNVDATVRIKYGERLFQVRSVFNRLEENSELHFLCEEVTT